MSVRPQPSGLPKSLSDLSGHEAHLYKERPTLDAIRERERMPETLKYIMPGSIRALRYFVEVALIVAAIVAEADPLPRYFLNQSSVRLYASIEASAL